MCFILRDDYFWESQGITYDKAPTRAWGVSCVPVSKGRKNSPTGLTETKAPRPDATTDFRGGKKITAKGGHAARRIGLRPHGYSGKGEKDLAISEAGSLRRVSSPKADDEEARSFSKRRVSPSRRGTSDAPEGRFKESLLAGHSWTRRWGRERKQPETKSGTGGSDANFW